MRLLGLDRLRRAEAQYRGSGVGKALAVWKRVVEAAKWRNFPDIKASWGGVDNVQGKVIFDIKGNKFRMTTTVSYEMQVVLVEKIQTHSEYTRKGI
jgi:mRNA interferase HigB